MTCYTIGHSKHTVEQFVNLIKTQGINLVVDVRSIPFSRHTPQFNRNSIQRKLNQLGLEYDYMGDVLGGKFSGSEFFNEKGEVDFRKAVKSDLFQKGLDTIIYKLQSSTNLVLMCAEKDPIYCHRFLLISRELDNRGIRVIHLLADGSVIDNDELVNNIALGKKQLDFTQIDFFSDTENAKNDMVYESLLIKKMKKIGKH